MNPLVAGILERAARTPHRIALHLGEGATRETWDWAELGRRMRVAAAGLSDTGVEPGDHLLLVLPDVRDAVAGLFGAWAVGAVPILAGLPFRAVDRAALLPNLRATAVRLDAAAIVAPPSLASPRTGTPRIIASGVLHGAEPLDTPVPAPGPALIQLTSGSLGRPRGVVIPAERLMRHLRAITRALPPGEDATGVSWLPLHHDMGLIGGLLYPLFNGIPLHLSSPAEFRRNPFGWIEALAHNRATHTAAPPSAYALAARLAGRARARGLELGALRCAMVGAEPIPPAVLRAFADSYRQCGLRPEALFPVYGLAEATVAVTFPDPLARTRFESIDRAALLGEGKAVPSDAEDALEFTGVGAPIPGTRVRILNDRCEPVADRVIGEIAVRSDSAMTGYYRDEKATRDVLRDGWLRTGDLGFLSGGTLYVTGRRKDLIIRAGQNLLPQAVEEAAESVAGVRSGGAAAIGIPSAMRGTERAVLVAETAQTPDRHPELVSRIADALKARLLEVDEIVLVPPRSLPRTSSGKLRRQALARRVTMSDTPGTQPIAP